MDPEFSYEWVFSYSFFSYGFRNYSDNNNNNRNDGAIFRFKDKTAEQTIKTFLNTQKR